jgi:hypothetical protein
MKPTYHTGEEVEIGDHVKIGAMVGTVEEIVLPGCALWQEYWKDETGEGVMLVGPEFGRMFMDFGDEDLTFVGRLRLPPFFDHEAVNLRWNLHPPVSVS